jgi:hypothetical protein
MGVVHGACCFELLAFQLAVEGSTVLCGATDACNEYTQQHTLIVGKRKEKQQALLHSRPWRSISMAYICTTVQ